MFGGCSVAKRLKEYDFSKTKGSKPLYPWDNWTDGNIWSVVHGVDFESAPGSFVVYLYHRAKQMDKRVRISIERGKRGKPDVVVFQFYEGEPEVAVIPKKRLRRLKRR